MCRSYPHSHKALFLFGTGEIVYTEVTNTKYNIALGAVRLLVQLQTNKRNLGFE